MKGFLGTIKAVNNSAKKATVSTTMFDRTTDVEVEFIQIQKVETPLPETTEAEEETNN